MTHHCTDPPHATLRRSEDHRIVRPAMPATKRREAVTTILIVGVIEIATASAVIYTSGFTLEFKV